MKWFKRWIVCLFFLSTFGLGGYIYLYPNQGTLFSENRTTMDKPNLTQEGLAQGTYFNQVNDYLQDTNPLRQDLIDFKVDFQGRVLGKPVVNNVYWKGDVNLPYVDGMDTDSLRPDLEAKEVGAFYKKLQEDCSKYGTRFLFVGIPNQTDIFSEQFPYYMENTKYLRTGEKALKVEFEKNGVQGLFLRDLMAKDPLTYYLKTDHHCTGEGLLVQGQAILDWMGSPYGKNIKEDFDRVDDPRPFVGSRSRKIPGLALDESFYYYRYKRPLGGKLSTGPLLDLGPGEKTVSYEIYMGGDQAYSIYEGDKKDGLKILVYGDSYTNGIETILAPYMAKMTSFDYRYGKKEDFFRELKTGDYDYCICIRDSGVYLKKSPNGLFY